MFIIAALNKRRPAGAKVNGKNQNQRHKKKHPNECLFS